MTASDVDRERRVGQVVGGKYRIVRFLAAGGMGVVFEAQHTVVRRRFAVKFLRPDLAEKRESLARFQREAQAAGELESEHLAAAVDFGVAGDGAPFIVMEYLAGESVEALLERDGCLPVERAADIVHQACHGVQAAHAAGIVHRDLKPQNLFLCRREDGTDLVKVLDFGIAKLEAAGQNAAATVTGTLLGTPAYMAPEQARGEKAVDHRADVYALGAILYELLSGRKPHPGDSHNAILHHIATQPALPLASVGSVPALPAALTDAVDRALSSDPSARFDSAEVFGRVIATFAKRTAWPEPERTPSRPSEDASAPTELAPAALARGGLATEDVAGRPLAPSRRWRGVAVLGGAVVVAGLWLATRSGGQPRAEASPPRPSPATTVGEVNAGELPLPAAPAPEPAPPKSSASPVTKPARAPAEPTKTGPRATGPRDRAPVPDPARSGAPLAFDRQNPYD